MKKILSIDWDYFINATASQRALMFPDGGNEDISYDLQDVIWNIHYQDDRLRDIGVLKKDYNLITKILVKYVGNIPARPDLELIKAMVTNSHKYIYEFIMSRTKENEEFELYNVDFHHDMYSFVTKGQRVNCGNWVNCLLEDRPNMKYSWIKREDSEDTVIGGEPVSCNIVNIKDLVGIDFDYIFICRSDCWSPPHLDPYFQSLWLILNKYVPLVYDERINSCREIKSTPFTGSKVVE